MDVIVRTFRGLSALGAALSMAVASADVAKADARAVGAVVDGEPHLEAQLLVASSNPESHRIRVGVLFDLAPGWHLYWRNPGATGLATRLRWHVAGAEVGPVQWPAPIAFRTASPGETLESYGYTGQVLLASDVVFGPGRPAHATGTDAPDEIRVDVDLLVCETECIPVSLQLSRDLGEQLRAPRDHSARALFDTYQARVPVPPSELGIELEAVYSQTALRSGDRFEAAILVRSCVRPPSAERSCVEYRPGRSGPSDAVFFPDEMEPIEVRVDRVTSAGSGSHRVELSGTIEPDEPIEVDRLTGVLALRGPAGETRHAEVDLPLPSTDAGAGAEVIELGRHWLGGFEGPGAIPGRQNETARPVRNEPAGLGLWRALLLALLGGLVLNLMPCVLPVLAIKVFSISKLAERSRDRSELLAHALAYTAGILSSMLALAACVILLRAAGRSVGWGFQFQEPVYVAAISIVLVAFALNLFGVFEIRVGAGALGELGSQATGARRSFFEGLLAVALATPCSAPFLGTAVGFAFASDPPVILAIFAAVGLGLAAPFAAVAAVPAWSRLVPRSGAWMQSVRTALGFVLLATVVWLLSVFGSSAGPAGIVGLLAFLVALASALWAFGLLQRSSRRSPAFVAGLLVVGLAVTGLNAVGARLGDPERRHAAAPASERAEDSRWRPWSATAVETDLAAGHPVFVRFTADWCITCKVNEHVVLDEASVQRAFTERGFSLFEADWTQRDDGIRAELARHGRAGVPLYLVMHPDRAHEPEVLPELLTRARLLAALDRSWMEGDADHTQTPKQSRSMRR